MPKKPARKPASKPKAASKSTIPTAPPVFDVSKPGETAADPTARPLIVNRKPMIKRDPMVTSEEDKPQQPPAAPAKPKKEVTIQPISEPAEEPKPSEEGEAAPPAETSDSGAIGALAEEISTKRQIQNAKDEADKKKEELEKIIAGKKYFLPIHDGVVARRGLGTIFINFLLVVLVLGAAAVLAVDAGYLHVPLELPFDLIK